MDKELQFSIAEVDKPTPIRKPDFLESFDIGGPRDLAFTPVARKRLSPSSGTFREPRASSGATRSPATRPPGPEKFIDTYTIGWICALQEEFQAAYHMLDESFDRPQMVGLNDNNAYRFGRIGGHYVVIGCLPMGRVGTSKAASVAKDMVRSFQNLKFSLMVGIGGGAPTKKADIRLGDVVVSVPSATLGGVVQYDFGKRLIDNRFERTGQLNAPPDALLSVAQEIKLLHDDPREPDRIAEHIRRMDNMDEYQRPAEDRLYAVDHPHQSQDEDDGCEGCGADRLINRRERKKPREIVVHYGTIASGNSIMRDAAMRDKYAKELKIMCFEMEAAGLMNDLPCLVIRGISDYSDSHKSDDWHNYAALTAAAYARELLILLKPHNVFAMPAWAGVVQTLSKDVTHIGESVSQIHKKLDFYWEDKKRKEILEWLSSHDVSVNHHIAHAKHEPTTGRWFFESDEFKHWKSGPDGVVWVHGIPGCGKTIMCYAIIEHLKDLCRVERDKAIAYFYFDFNNSFTKQAANCIRSIIAQLAGKRKAIPGAVRKLYDDYVESKEQPTLRTLITTLSSIIECYEKCYIVFDALDEFGSADNREEILKVFRDMVSISVTKKRAHILVTSREESDIQEALKTLQPTEILMEAAKVDGDIRLYIHKRLEDLFNRHTTSLKERIISLLIRKAEGMFRWVACQLDELRKCIRPKDLEIALEEMPETLYATYDRILEKIDSAHCGLAKAAFRWLAFSERPLYLDEVAEAAILEPGLEPTRQDRLFFPESLLEICSSLITTVTTTERGIKHQEIRFAHSSVKEYLVSNPVITKPLASFFFSELDSQEYLATSCVSYISLLRKYPSISEETVAQLPLLRYAARYWPDHVSHLRSKKRMSQELRNLILNILDPKITTIFLHWLCVYDPDQPWREEKLGTASLVNPPSPLYYASSFGLTEIVNSLLEEGTDVNAAGGRYGSALQVAAWMGYEEVTRLLLKSGAKIDAEDGLFGCAIHMAASKGHAEVVELLLKFGAKANVSSGDYGSALHAAAESGQGQVVKLLLAKPGLISNSKDKLGRTPLTWAAYNGHVNVVQILLECQDADPDCRDNSKYSPLWWAAQNGHDEVVRVLLTKQEVKADWRNAAGKTPLTFAAQNGHVEVVRLLLQRDDVDPDSRDECNISPLTRAAQNGYLPIVRMLLERGADPDPKGMYGETPLAGAAQQGHSKVMKLLLNRKVDKEYKNAHGQTPLDLALTQGHEEVIELLKGYTGASIESEITSFGQDPPAYYSESENSSFVDEEADEKYLQSDQPQPPSAFAVLGLGETLFLYYQGDDQKIYELRWRAAEKQSGNPHVIVSAARAESPIAVTGWQWDGIVQIRLYYLNQDNRLREHAYDTSSGWIYGALNSQDIEVAPFSQLSATSWPDRNLRVFFQAEDLKIHEVCGTAACSGHAKWHTFNRSAIAPAARGCSMGILNFQRSLRTSLRFYFESEPQMLREKCWEDGAWDATFGFYQLEIAQGAAITAVAWGSLGTENSDYEGLYMRVYILDGDGCVVEICWRYGWAEPKIIADDGLAGGKIAAVQRGSSDADLELRVYYSSCRKNVINQLVFNEDGWKPHQGIELRN